MTVPAGTLPSMKIAQEANGMGMEHCQDAQKKQCRCSGCACVPLVVGMTIQPVIPLVVLERFSPDVVPRFYRMPLVPPFRPPIL